MEAMRPVCSECGRDLILVPSGLLCTECVGARIIPLLLYVADSKGHVKLTGIERNHYRKGSGIRWASWSLTAKKIKDLTSRMV